MCVLAPSALADSKSSVRKNGDVLEIVIPLLSLATTLVVEDDYSGSIQFLKAFTTSELSTAILKRLTHKRRPNGNCCASFPSGHTSASFMGASFIQYRYGWKYAIPAYAAATYVAYSRVHSNQHYTIDVVAGAAVGILSSYFFTQKYQGFNISPITDNGELGIQISRDF